MRKVFLVLACCLVLGLMPSGSSAKNSNPGPESVPISYEVPKTEAQATKLLEIADKFLKEKKYKEALDLVEKVKKSNLKDAITKANSQETKISKEVEANASLEIARHYLDAIQPKEALDLVENAIKSNPNIKIKEKDLIIRILKEKADENNKKLRALIKAGASSLKTGDYDEAIKKANEVLSGPLSDATIRQEAECLLIKAVDEKIKNTKRLQSFQLNVAKRLTEQEDFDKASEKIIKDVIPSIRDDEVFNEAKEAWSKTQPNFWYKLYIDILTYLKWPIIGVLLTALLCGLLKLLSLGYKKLLRISKKLQFLELNDETKFGVKDLFVAALYRWKVDKAAGTDGQLRLIPPRSSFLLGPLPQEKLSPALEKLPTIGSIPVGDLGKTITFVGKWFAYCPPWLSANFISDEKGQIVAQVTLERKKGRVALLSIWPEPAQPAGDQQGVAGQQIKEPNAAGEPPVPSKPSPTDQNPDPTRAVKLGVESLAFKVLYLLADEKATVDEAEAFDQLRIGMALLNRYIDGENFEKFDNLKRSLDFFQKVRERWPRLLPAYLYEGLALGLLQDHDKAARNFQFVKQQAQEEGDEGLRQRAAYNEAWAHLQKYTYEEVNKSMSLLDALIGDMDENPFKNSPFKAKAYADKAIAIAYLPLFWRKVLPKSPTKDEIQHWLNKLQQQILTITQTLKHLLEKINQDLRDGAKTALAYRDYPEWNRSDYRRLQWALHNAWGKFYLNCAVDILADSRLLRLEGFEQQDFLDRARNEFQECELLLPPRVETLADIGTLFLFLKDEEGNECLDEARNYLEKAKNWNKWYEYAFYRLAQTYEKANDIDKVVETLNEFKESKRPPRLKSFKEMYEKYGNSPRLELGEQEQEEIEKIPGTD